MDETSLAHRAYTEMKCMHIEYVWSTAIESLILKANVSGDQSQYQIIKTIKSVLQDQYLTYSQHKLFDDNNKPHGNKLRSFRTYKTIFQKEEYLTIKSMSIRSDFARLNLNCDVISEFTKYVHSCFVRRKESTLRQN